MKDKILTFIIGVLVGAIIASVGYYFYYKNNQNTQMPSGTPLQMMQDGNNSGMPNGTPPELPNGEKPNSNNESSTNTQSSEQTQSNSLK